MFTYRYISLSRDSNGSNLSTDTLPRAPCVSQAIVRSSMVQETLNVLPIKRNVNRAKTWCKPKCRVWTWYKPNCFGSFHVNVKDSMWTIFQARTAIKSVLWLVSNGWLVAEIWSFQVLGWSGAPKLSFCWVYMLWFTCLRLSFVPMILGLHLWILDSNLV
jgi:hypothetical protein